MYWPCHQHDMPYSQGISRDILQWLCRDDHDSERVIHSQCREFHVLQVHCSLHTWLYSNFHCFSALIQLLCISLYRILYFHKWEGLKPWYGKENWLFVWSCMNRHNSLHELIRNLTVLHYILFLWRCSKGNGSLSSWGVSWESGGPTEGIIACTLNPYLEQNRFQLSSILRYPSQEILHSIMKTALHLNETGQLNGLNPYQTVYDIRQCPHGSNWQTRQT